MLLGKRPRPPMKRTTSLSEITFYLNETNDSSSSCSDSDCNETDKASLPPSVRGQKQKMVVVGGYVDQRFLSSTVSPRTLRASADFHETAQFLKVCSLCKRRLIPGRDIYMYRGDSAFCSLECRQQQMSHDERKEKCSSFVSKKDAVAVTVATIPEALTEGETVAAV